MFVLMISYFLSISSQVYIDSPEKIYDIEYFLGKLVDSMDIIPPLCELHLHMWSYMNSFLSNF